VLVDAGGAITYVSPSSFALLGLTPDELIGRTAASMIHPDFVGELLPILIQPRGTCSFTSDTQLVRADGTAVWVAASTSVVYDADSGRAIEFRSSLRDITDRKLLELALEQQALHDPLTGLANRELLQRNLAEATSGAQAGQLAVLLLDLDGFKEVNDTFGHAVGDVVLQTIAERLRELTRASDTLARTGGDEFVLLCPGVDEAAGVRVAERIVRAIGAPVLAGEVFVELGASVGVAHGAGESADSDRLLLDADRAMYAAKRAGRGCVRTATHVGLRA
jgi:diguanylate cyclase (GGDEF)-like protein/PAS domain S-box-containing protein